MKGRRSGFRSDQAGSGALQVMEAIIVVGLVVSAIVVVTDTQTSNAFRRQHDQPPRIDEGHLDSWVWAYLTMPPSNKTVRFGSALEQWMVESLQGDDSNLFARVQGGLGVGVESEGWISTHYSELLVYGKYHPPNQKKTAVTLDYEPGWGFTIAETGLSHYNPGQPVDVSLLPIFAKGAGFPLGIVYDAEFEGHLMGDTPVWGRVSDTTTIHEDEDFNAPRLTFTDAQGAARDHEAAAGLGLDGANRTWSVHVKFQALNETSERSFLHSGETWSLRVPPGWSGLTLERPDKWEQVASPYEANLTLQYLGLSRRVAETEWLNFTLQQPITHTLPRVGVLRLEREGDGGARGHYFLLDKDNDDTMGFNIHLSHPNPNIVKKEGPWWVHLVNGRDENVYLDRLTVFFELGNFSFGPDPAGWTSSGDLTSTTFTYIEPLTVPKGEVVTLPLDLDFTRAPAFSPYHASHPTIKRGDTTYASFPSGYTGMHEAWLPAEVAAVGQRQFTVPDIANVPGGTGSYTVLPEPIGLLSDLQAVHDTMRLDISPRIHQPHEKVDIQIDTGDLLEKLRSSTHVESNHINLTLEVYNALGWLIGEPHTEATFQMGLKQGPPVRGLQYIPLNSDATSDLLVAFGDGNLIALDGLALPDVALWQRDLGDDITTGPFIDDWVGDGQDEILVTTTEGVDAHLVLLDLSGNEENRVQLAGPAYRTTPWDCEGEPGVAFFAYALYGNAAPSELSERYGLGNTNLDTHYRGAVPTLYTWRTTVGLDQGPEYGDGVMVTALNQGRFAPEGACDLAYGFSGGQIHRTNGTTLDPVWSRTGSGDLIGFWVGDTHTTTTESETGTSGDEVLAAWTGTGFMVLEADDPMIGGEWETHPDVLMDPTDELIGLTWVNETIGYLVSKEGLVWRTTDAGTNFEPAFAEQGAVRILDPEPGLEIVDFAAGGDGNLIFRTSDNTTRGYVKGRLEGWVEMPSNTDIHGFTELADGPGVIVQSLERTRLTRWDFLRNSPAQDSVWSIDCRCAQASGNSNGLVGATDKALFWNSTIGQGEMEQKAEAATLAPDGTVGILYEATVLSSNGFSSKFLDRLRPEQPTYAAKRSLEAANVMLQNSMVRIKGDQAAAMTVEKANFTGVSTGPGPALAFSKDRILKLIGNDHSERQPILPLIELPASTFAPVVVDLDDHAPLLIVMDQDQVIRIYNITSGLPTQAVDLNLLEEQNVGVVRSIPNKGGHDSVWIESRPSVSISTPVPNLDLGQDMHHEGGHYQTSTNWHRLDAEAGTITCSKTQSGLVPGATTKGMALDSVGTIVLGSDLGVLSKVDAGSCSAAWQTTPVYLGSIRNIATTAPGKAMLGPQIVQVTSSFDLEGLPKFEMRLSGHSTMSESGYDMSLLIYELHWTAWDPLD